jgi:hypothetical protein
METKRKIHILITVLVIAMILIAGTFAWQQTINKVNEFIGHKNGIIVHDDFDPATGAKDVYVENPNSAEVFVRVKLNEVMSITSNAKITAGWQAHTFEDYANEGVEISKSRRLLNDS